MCQVVRVPKGVLPVEVACQRADWQPRGASHLSGLSEMRRASRRLNGAAQNQRAWRMKKVPQVRGAPRMQQAPQMEEVSWMKGTAQMGGMSRVKMQSMWGAWHLNGVPQVSGASRKKAVPQMRGVLCMT